jgi:O-antigen/teichoic acid export membrane protein
MIARIVRNAASLASAQFVTKLAGLAATIVVARALHASGFGAYAATWAYGMLVGVLADGGLPYFIALEVARVPRAARRLAWTAFALRLGLAAGALVPAVALLPLLRFTPAESAAAIIFTVGALADGIANQALAYFRGVARMHVEASVVTIGRVLYVAATLIALAWPSLLAFAVAQGTASVVSAVLATIVLARSVSAVQPRRAALGAIARGALPFAASGLLTYVYFRIDVLLMRGLGVADAGLGAYSAAYRVMEAPRSAFGSIAAGVLPAATALAHPRRRSEFRALGARAATIALWTVAPATVAFLVAPHTVTSLIFGRGYDAAAGLLWLLAPMPLLMAADAIAVSLVNAVGGQRTITGIFALCAAVNVATNLLLIPAWGARGAAVATVVTEVVQLTALLTVVARRIGVVRPALGSLALAACAAVLVAALLPESVVRIAAAVLVYAAVALVVAGRLRMVRA